MTGRRNRSGRVPAVGLLAVVVVAVFAPGVATAGDTPSGAAAASVGATTSDIEQTFTVESADEGVRVTASYQFPDRVSSATVRLPVAGTDDGEVAGFRGFDRANATTFEWTGADQPRIELTVDADNRRVTVGDGWAFVFRPDVSVAYGYRGEQPAVRTTFDTLGEGYAAGAVAYLGAHRTATVTAGGEQTTLVVADASGPVDLDAAREFVEVAPGRFDLGVRRSSTAAFVLPRRETGGTGPRVAGAAVETSFWVEPEAVELETTSSAFTHEYVHTRLGPVGRGSARWLTEATAEYFGYAFALNAGVGGYEEFRADATADRYDPSRNPVTLSEPSAWEGTLANYQKGAHVLAALDAEIRRRTDGNHTLGDVFVGRSEPFADHAAFRAAVVETTGVDALEGWVDRYVTTDALPPIPEEPSRFVYGEDLDPDGDGAKSGHEISQGTNPFVAASAPDTTATPSPTPTETAAETTGTTQVTPTPTPTVADASPPTVSTPTPSPTDATTGSGDGFGGPATVAALGVTALALAAARRRR